MRMESERGREFGNPPHHNTGKAEDLRKRVATTGNQQHEPGDLMLEQTRRIIRDILFEGREERSKNTGSGRREFDARKPAKGL